MLAVDALAALETTAELAEALGETPVLSVASPLRIENGAALPSDDALSLAERMQDLLRGPVVAGLHSLAARSLAAGKAEGDALVCGDDDAAKAAALELAAHARHRARPRCRPARERPGARRHDGGDRQPQPPLPRTRGPSRRGPVTELTIRPFAASPSCAKETIWPA